MRILGIDPGPKTSGVVRLDLANNWRAWYFSGCIGDPPAVELVDSWNTASGAQTEASISDAASRDFIAIEWLTSYGMAVGAATFDTAKMVGRFEKTADTADYTDPMLITRPQVAAALCGSTRAKDSQMSLACRELVPQTGGGAKPAVGTKNEPGPLNGIKGPHAWSALHVAFAAAILMEGT